MLMLLFSLLISFSFKVKRLWLVASVEISILRWVESLHRVVLRF